MRLLLRVPEFSFMALKEEELVTEQYVKPAFIHSVPSTHNQPLLACVQESIPTEGTSSRSSEDLNSDETADSTEASEVMSRAPTPLVRNLPMGVRTTSFLTDFQLDQVMRGLQAVLPDRPLSIWSMRGSVVADQFGRYSLELVVSLTQEEGDRMVHQLAGIDRAESPPGYDHLYNDWEGGTDLGPEYEENFDV